MFDHEYQEQARMADKARQVKQAQSVDPSYNRLPHPVNECATEASCGRVSARAVLEQRYDALLREANGVHALMRALPNEMSHAAEEALWRIVVDQRR